jgi:hypothetical protein
MQALPAPLLLTYNHTPHMPDSNYLPHLCPAGVAHIPRMPHSAHLLPQPRSTQQQQQQQQQLYRGPPGPGHPGGHMQVGHKGTCGTCEGAPCSCWMLGLPVWSP